MQSQLAKISVLCNICFWLSMLFRYWKNARNIAPDLLNTIVILGVVATLVNIIWMVFVWQKKIKPSWFYLVFNVGSFLVQIISVISFLL